MIWFVAGLALGALAVVVWLTYRAISAWLN